MFINTLITKAKAEKDDADDDIVVEGFLLPLRRPQQKCQDEKNIELSLEDEPML